ncbi:hypothetical protein SGRIM128S_06747 [Streptomyces griseomycini]
MPSAVRRRPAARLRLVRLTTVSDDAWDSEAAFRPVPYMPRALSP